MYEAIYRKRITVLGGAHGTPEREKFDEEAFAFYTGQIVQETRAVILFTEMNNLEASLEVSNKEFLCFRPREAGY